MRVLIVAENARAGPLAQALEAEGTAVRFAPQPAPARGGEEEIEQIAAALIAFEEVLRSDAPDAVLLAGSSNLALAAAIVATKLQIPVLGLAERGPVDDQGLELNRRLIERLADGLVAADASAVAAWLRGSRAD
jgi:UDP-N-acetylglucosamine 2-epimerase